MIGDIVYHTNEEVIYIYKTISVNKGYSAMASLVNWSLFNK